MMFNMQSCSEIETMAEALVIDARAASVDEYNAGLGLGSATLEHMRHVGDQLLSEVKYAIVRHQSRSREMQEGFAKVIAHRLYFNR